MVITHLQDHLGSEHFTTNSAGNVNGTTTYFPFGAVQNSSSNGQYANNFAYLGEEKDTESGLQYLNARYYHPARGVFVSQDPVYLNISESISLLLDPQITNSYAYGRNNPYTMVDPDGNIPWGGLSLNGPYMRGVARFVSIGTKAIDFITGGMYSNAIEMSSATGQLASDETNVATVGLMLAGPTIGTASASAGALTNSASSGGKVAQVSVNAIKGVTGESIVRASFDIGQKEIIKSMTGTASYRIADGLIAGKSINEVKNVAYQSLTNQIKDFVAYAEQQAIELNLYVRESTKLTSPLQSLVDKGSIVLHRVLP